MPRLVIATRCSTVAIATIHDRHVILCQFLLLIHDEIDNALIIANPEYDPSTGIKGLIRDTIRPFAKCV